MSDDDLSDLSLAEQTVLKALYEQGEPVPESKIPELVVLMVLRDADEPLSSREISDRAGFKSEALHGTILSLAQTGQLVRLPDDKYQLPST